MVNIHALLAVGVNADGHREILGLQVTSAEGGGWLAFFLCVPRILPTALTSRVAVPASGRDDHPSYACGSCSS